MVSRKAVPWLLVLASAFAVEAQSIEELVADTADADPSAKSRASEVPHVVLEQDSSDIEKPPAIIQAVEAARDTILVLTKNGTDEFIGVSGKPQRTPQSLDKTWAIIKQLPSDLARKIGRDNAACVYNMD